MTRTRQDVAVAELRRLEEVVTGLDGVAVGLSGGVDSSVLSAVSHRVHAARAVAVIARSPSLPQRELDAALAVADQIGIRVEVVDTEEVADQRYAANPRNRCLFCKEHQFAALRSVADRLGFAHIAHGETLDDLEDHRPGRGAASTFAVRAPLREAGLDKAAVRVIARDLDLPVWDKPAFACLASRIPHGDEVTVEKLAQIEKAEQQLVDLGFRAFRVRHHGTLARIEVEPADHASVLHKASEIVATLRGLGFEHVTLDLAGLGASRLRSTPTSGLPLFEGTA